MSWSQNMCLFSTRYLWHFGAHADCSWNVCQGQDHLEAHRWRHDDDDERLWLPLDLQYLYTEEGERYIGSRVEIRFGWFASESHYSKIVWNWGRVPYSIHFQPVCSLILLVLDGIDLWSSTVIALSNGSWSSRWTPISVQDTPIDIRGVSSVIQENGVPAPISEREDVDGGDAVMDTPPASPSVSAAPPKSNGRTTKQIDKSMGAIPRTARWPHHGVIV